MNALVRSNPAAANLPAIVSGEFASLPAPIRKALVKIDLAFPAGLANLAPGEVDIRNDVYAEAIEGFPGVVVAAALKRLLLNNPRNPFAPTPQDVRNECRRFSNQLHESIISYMMGGKWALSWDCPPPGADGHPFTMQTARLIVKASDIWRQSLERFWNLHPNHPSRGEDELDSIRACMFDKGERDDLIAERKRRLEERQRWIDQFRKEHQRDQQKPARAQPN